MQLVRPPYTLRLNSATVLKKVEFYYTLLRGLYYVKVKQPRMVLHKKPFKQDIAHCQEKKSWECDAEKQKRIKIARKINMYMLHYSVHVLCSTGACTHAHAHAHAHTTHAHTHRHISALTSERWSTCWFLIRCLSPGSWPPCSAAAEPQPAADSHCRGTSFGV